MEAVVEVIFLACTEPVEVCQGRGSDSRHVVYDTTALPLSYPDVLLPPHRRVAVEATTNELRWLMSTYFIEVAPQRQLIRGDVDAGLVEICRIPELCLHLHLVEFTSFIQCDSW